MELRDFLKPFFKNWKMLVAFPVVFGLAACVATARLPARYRASTTLFVRKEPEISQGEYYTYDGYYAQKASEEYTDTVLGLLERDYVRQQVAEKLWGGLDAETRRRLNKAIAAEKSAPQLIDLAVTWDNGDTARQVTTLLAQEVKAEAEFTQAEGASRMEIVSLNPEPLVKEVEPQQLLNSLVGAGAGFLLAIILIWLKEYLS